MSLSDFVDDVKEREKTLTVFTEDDDEELFSQLRDFFDVQTITVRRGHVEGGGPQNFVVLHQEDDAVAVSTLNDVRDSLFLGEEPASFRRSDAALPNGKTPDVVSSLGNTTFSVDSEDWMLVTQISNYIGELAFRTGEGTVHSGVRRLSALAEDASRMGMYRKLADAGLETHVYGRGDADPPALPGVSIHPTDDEEIARTRFDVFDGAGDDASKAAMVAIEASSESFRGFWTFEAGLVDDLLAYVRDTYI